MDDLYKYLQSYGNLRDAITWIIMERSFIREKTRQGLKKEVPPGVSRNSRSRETINSFWCTR